MSADLIEHFKLSRLTGVLVIKVVPGSPADKAGIRRGDVLLTMDKHEIENRTQFRQRLAMYSVGNVIEFAALRDGRHCLIESPHPSPLSAHRGFFGSRPFSRTNDFLAANGRGTVDWTP